MRPALAVASTLGLLQPGLARAGGAEACAAALAQTLSAIPALAGRVHRSRTTVSLDGGDVPLGAPLVLSCRSDGGPDEGVSLRSTPGRPARFIGSEVLGAPARPAPALEALLPAEARDHVLAFTLPAAVLAGFGSEPPVSATSDAPATVMLTQGGRPLAFARWPAVGYARTPALPGPERSPVFAAPAARAASWRREADLRAGGYWSFDWSYETVRLTATGDAMHASRLSRPYPTAPQYRYFVYNAVSELRGPGEFAVSPSRGELLVWPWREPAGGVPLRLVRLDHLLEIDGARNIRLEGLAFADVLGPAILIRNAEDVVLSRVAVSDTGGEGVVVGGGRGVRIERSAFDDIGGSAVVLDGGDRRLLTPGGHILADSTISNAGQRFRTGHAAVELSGVGNAVTGCLIRDTPHSAIQLEGNDHRITGDTIVRAVTETGDAGAIYAGRDVSARGVQISGNRLSDIMAHDGSPTDVRGIYLDDFTSGYVVENNLFDRVRDAIYINGGSDNRVEGNRFSRPIGPPITVRDASGDWLQNYGDLRRRAEPALDNPSLYLRRYPDLKLPGPAPPGPPVNTLRDNVVVAPGR